MITKEERREFEERKAEILKEVYRRGKEKGLKPRPSIHDRWESDAKMYDQLMKRKKGASKKSE